MRALGREIKVVAAVIKKAILKDPFFSNACDHSDAFSRGGLING
jgi:hypothetical protein